MVNAYEVLGIRNFATQKEIRLAYRSMSKKYHPDLHQGEVFYEEKFKEIQAAYNTLSNIEQRMELDCYLRQLHHKEIMSKQQEQNAPEDLTESEFKRTVIDKKEFHTTGRVTEQKQVNTQQNYMKTIICVLIVLVLTTSAIYYFFEKPVNSESIVDTHIFETDKDKTFYSLGESGNLPDKTKTIEDGVIDNSKRFFINATKNEVQNIQGEPTGVVEVSALKQEIWYYEMSSVTFENGRLSEYANHGDNLKVAYFKTVKKGNPRTFSVGATRLEVLSALGDPTCTMRIKPLDQEIWYYGESRILFEKGEVSEFSNTGQNLLVQGI